MVFQLTAQESLRRLLNAHTRLVYRLGSRGFALFLLLELLLLLAVLAWATDWVNQTTPYARSGEVDRVRHAVIARLAGIVEDPLIEVIPGVSARSSNLRGFRREGVNYYYFVEGERNYDPLSRGMVHEQDVEVLLRDNEGPRTFVIYRLR
jgi:hypothetical protein